MSPEVCSLQHEIVSFAGLTTATQKSLQKKPLPLDFFEVFKKKYYFSVLYLKIFRSKLMKSLQCQNCLSIQYSHFQTSFKLGNIVSFSYTQFFITSEDGVFNHSIRNIGRALTVSTSYISVSNRRCSGGGKEVPTQKHWDNAILIHLPLCWRRYTVYSLGFLLCSNRFYFKEFLSNNLVLFVAWNFHFGRFFFLLKILQRWT